ncbi:MAG: hypothetical protein OZSIB_0192 [Candidatus Ozemobacter sibiricus]|jgi:hypothetical protein|uniref:Uncharacterized protein n=1 Tax=Candidatus Ozemobacter sibiricus TaxID=2268124 RepID=A0A367ZPN3_9BACT|nr:MAG: hypothetical protein OZSIB_0192 [Candidatus Ozemobacter sibiricus]
MRSRRRGFALLILLALAVLAVGFALIYHQWSRHGQQVSFRIEQAETMRLLAESAMEEAFAWLHRECSDYRSATAAWVREPSAPPLAIPLPGVGRWLATSLRGGPTVELTAEARHVDRRTEDHDGAPFFRPDDGSPGEAVGTIECRVTATLWQRDLLTRTRLATGRLLRHHDVWVVSMVTPRLPDRPRAAYAHNFVLDYVLLVRDGLAEFRESEGRSLNPAALPFTIDQDDLPSERRGRISFGGTDSTKPPIALGDQDPLPRFFNRAGLVIDGATTGPAGFRPWGHFSLWHRRQVPPDAAMLEGIGLLDRRRRVLRLNGIVHLAGELVVGDPEAPWTIEGQGVLIAPAITVRGSLIKARPDDLCVLFARRGPITVETERRVEAALVAVNDAKTGCVLARRALDLRGALIVDRLATERWASGVAHRLAYDPALTSPDRASYVVNLSRWISFQRWVLDAPEAAP